MSYITTDSENNITEKGTYNKCSRASGPHKEVKEGPAVCENIAVNACSDKMTAIE